ncbi:MAG: hypothetical protein ABFS41_00065 [Myxococcota bacterium]
MAQSFEEYNGCRVTSEDPCIRNGSCSIQGSTWWQEVVAARSDTQSSMGWAGVCDLVHVAFLQGSCTPGGQRDVIALLTASSLAWTPRIQGGLACASVVTEVCADGLDNDWDGLIDATADAGCAGTMDFSERHECDDGVDNDGDGWTDAELDPGCRDTDGVTEDPQCQDGIDNDGASGTDFDGGISVLGTSGADPTGPDPQCDQAWKDREAAPHGACGLGPELAAILGTLLATRRWRKP